MESIIVMSLKFDDKEQIAFIVAHSPSIACIRNSSTAVMFYFRNLCQFLCYYITTNAITVPLPILFSIVFLLQLHFLFYFINIVLLPLPCIYFSSTIRIVFHFL